MIIVMVYGLWCMVYGSWSYLNSTFLGDEKRIWKTKSLTPCPSRRFEGELTLSTLIKYSERISNQYLK